MYENIRVPPPPRILSFMQLLVFILAVLCVGLLSSMHGSRKLCQSRPSSQKVFFFLLFFFFLADEGREDIIPPKAGHYRSVSETSFNGVSLAGR